MTLSADEKSARLNDFADASSRLFERDNADLSSFERVFRAVWELDAQINDGGFHRYFTRSSCVLVPTVVAALKEIGASQMARIADSAIKSLGADLPWSDQETMESHLDLDQMPPKLMSRLDKLNAEFLAYPEPLAALLYDYVAEHKDELGAASDF
jgi:Domain of unknown function (DUF4375)